jgi:hypothetical protein
MSASTSSSGPAAGIPAAPLEVFYSQDGVNTWLECDVIDIITQSNGAKLFKVFVQGQFQSV